MTRFRDYVRVEGHGTVGLPAEWRRRHQLDQAGAHVEISEREEGVAASRPTTVPASQAWLWFDKWQRRERKADEDIAAVRVSAYDDVDAFIKGMDDSS